MSTEETLASIQAQLDRIERALTGGAQRKGFLRVKDAAELAGVSLQTMRNYVADGTVRSFRLGGTVIIHTRDLEAAIRARKRHTKKDAEQAAETYTDLRRAGLKTNINQIAI